MNKLLLLGISVLVFTTGCLTPAKKLEPAAVDTIKPNQTTRADVEKQFGKPGTLTTGAEGKSLAQYSFSTGGSYGAPLQLRVLSLLYTPHFIVERKLLSEGTLEQHTKFFGLSRVGDAFDREKIIHLLKVGTVRDEIIAELGPPLIEELNLSGETLMTWFALQEGVPFFKRMEGQTLVIRLDEHGILLDFKILGTLEPKKQP